MPNILIISNLKEIISYIKVHKIKHKPFRKVVDEYGNIYHACEIMKQDDMVLMSLAFFDKYKLPKEGEKYWKYGQHSSS